MYLPGREPDAAIGVGTAYPDPSEFERSTRFKATPPARPLDPLRPAGSQPGPGEPLAARMQVPKTVRWRRSRDLAVPGDTSCYPSRAGPERSLRPGLPAAGKYASPVPSQPGQRRRSPVRLVASPRTERPPRCRWACPAEVKRGGVRILPPFSLTSIASKHWLGPGHKLAYSRKKDARMTRGLPHVVMPPGRVRTRVRVSLWDKQFQLGRGPVKDGTR